MAARFKASLRIKSGQLPLEEIQANLGIAPSAQHRVGDSIEAKFPHGHKGVFSSDMWIAQAPIDPFDPLRRHVAWIRQLVESNRSYLCGLQQKGATFDIVCFCKLSSDSVSLSLAADDIAMLGAAGISIDFLIIR